MKLRRDAGRWAILAGVVLALGAVEALAQARVMRPDAGRGAGGAAVRIRAITGQGPRALVRTPDFAGGSTGNRGNIQWAALTVQFDTEPDWIDELTLQYYVLLTSRVTGESRMLKGAATYIDVARGRGHLAASYVRPAALLRFGEVVAVAVEAVIKGEVVASQSEGRLQGKPLPQDWWKTVKLTPVEGYIMNKDKTPFAYVAFDDYESLK